MASGTVVTDLSATSEEVEKEEMKKIDACEGKIEDKAVGGEVPAAGDESKKVEEVEKIEEAPVVEAITPTEPEPAEKQGGGICEGKLEEAAEVVVHKIGETPAEVVEASEAKEVVEAIEQLKTEAKAVDVSESLPAEVIEKIVEKAEDTPADVVEATEAKDESGTQPAPVVESEAKPVEEVETKSCAEEAVLPTSLPESSDPAIKVEEDKAESHPVEVKTEGAEEKCVVAEELVQSEEKPTEEAKASAEKVAEDQPKSRDIESVVDNGVEKCEAAAEEPEKIEEAAEAKLVEEKIKESEAKLDEEKPSLTDVPNQENVEESVDTKPSQEVGKEDVPVKTQKQSIVKMMKQSLVKAKKAIIGKSNNSKAPTAEPKDDGNK